MQPMTAPVEPHGVTGTFVHPCPRCGRTVHVVDTVEQPHECAPAETAGEGLARAWWAGHAQGQFDAAVESTPDGEAGDWEAGFRAGQRAMLGRAIAGLGENQMIREGDVKEWLRDRLAELESGEDIPRQRKGINAFLPDAPVRKTFADEGVMQRIESWRDSEREKEAWHGGDTQTYRYRANLLEAALVRWRAAAGRPPVSSPVQVDGERPEIVVLCGSTRFYDEFQQANYDLTMQGKIVLSVGFYPHAKAQHGHGEGVGHDSAEKAALDELHKRKIDLADRVLVLNVGGYLGKSTRSEIRYAWSIAHKPVEFLWHEPDEHHDGFMHGLCPHGEPRGQCIGINSWEIK